MSTLPGALYHPHISFHSLKGTEEPTTKFVIAANTRMNIKYVFVRDSPASGLNVLEESVPERISKRSTPCVFQTFVSTDGGDQATTS